MGVPLRIGLSSNWLSLLDKLMVESFWDLVLGENWRGAGGWKIGIQGRDSCATVQSTICQSSQGLYFLVFRFLFACWRWPKSRDLLNSIDTKN